MLDLHTLNIIAGLMKYSFDPIQWDFNRLSDTEKIIIGNQINLDIIKKTSVIR